MTYKEKYGRYEVNCKDGYQKWFKYLDKAQKYFNEFADDLEYDLEGTGDREVVRLIDLKTNEEIMVREING